MFKQKWTMSICAAAMLAACGDDAVPARVWECQFEAAETAPDYLKELGCKADFDALASVPSDVSLSGVRSVKTVIDLEDEGALYFQDSNKFPIHHEFVSEHLSVAAGHSPVPALNVFNQTEYTSLDRRFVLGTITYYDALDVWAYEIASYDRASAEMIEQAYRAIVEHAFFGADLKFHPDSVSVEAEAEKLPADVAQVSTTTLYEGIDYQPLNLATSIGRLRFIKAADLDTEYLTFRDIAVLDHVPNDISVSLGIITAEFQTPLAHINVLSQNRGTPNMALRGAFEDESLRALEGKWVRLTVGANEYSIEEVTKEASDAFWEKNQPEKVEVPGANLDVTDLRDLPDMIDFSVEESGEDKRLAIKRATQAFGGKAANYAALTEIEDITVPEAFAIPIFYYFQFMQDNGFDDRVTGLLADPEFQEDPAVRDAALNALRDDMKAAPVNPEFEQVLLTKIAGKYPQGMRLRFRSSTNAEDLEGFTGAGLYTSKSGDPNDPAYPVLDAVRKVWASVWFFRAFEERSYRQIDHTAVGMALLVHRSFPEEEANGVAITANPYDKSGLEPAFYVNVQWGDASVVLPEAGATTDQFLYYYLHTGQPTTYLSYSNQTPDWAEQGDTVMSRANVNALGKALSALRTYFTPIYGSNDWWAMDVEFKLEDDGGDDVTLYIKQARPFGDR